MTEHQPLDTSPLPVKLRVEDYLLLDDAGAFDGYAKTELIEGEIVSMNAQHRPHARVKSRLHVLLASALQDLGAGMEALVEGSVAMPPHSVPEPDIAVTAEPEGDGLIPLASLALIVEIADSTLQNDLGRKQQLYAREGVPEYWVVDVIGRMIHQFWGAGCEAYAGRRMVAFGDRIAAETVAGLAVETKGL
ncbi:MAG TPA: Uma2 family endonuclease [Croceibacterium sp.]